MMSLCLLKRSHQVKECREKGTSGHKSSVGMAQCKHGGLNT